MTPEPNWLQRPPTLRLVIGTTLVIALAFLVLWITGPILNTRAQGTFVFLFGCALPASVFLWVLGILAAGFLRDPEDQPRVFGWVATNGIVAAAVRSLEGSDPSPVIVALAGLLLAFFNFIPFAILANADVSLSTVLDLAYLMVQVVWLATVAQAIARARSRLAEERRTPEARD